MKSNTWKMLTSVSAAVLLTAPLGASAEELIIWSRGDWGAMMVDGFNAKMKAEGRDVVAVNNLIGGGDFAIKFTAALTSGERVDVAAIDLINVPFYSSQGALVDITDFLKSQPYYDNLNKAQLALGSIGDSHYAAPNAADVSGYVYNKNSFKEMGFDNPPSNWAEMTTACKTFADAGKIMIAWSGNDSGGQMFTVMPGGWANGGSFVSADGKTAELNDQKNVAFYEFYQSLIELGCTPTNVGSWSWGDFHDGFLAGDVAMIGTGQFMVNTVKDYPDLDVGFIPFFSEDGSANSAFVGGDLVAVPATTGNKDLAMEYIAYVLSRAGQVDVYSAHGGIPIRSDLFEGNPYLDANLMMFSETSKVGYVPYTTVYQELMGPYLVAMQKIWAGEDVTASLDEGNAAMQRILDSTQ